jgi:methyl-accepting chemotaxis protein
MRFTVKLKLALSFAGIILISVGAATLGITSLASLDRILEDLLQGPVQRGERTLTLDSDFLLILRAEKNVILSDNKEQQAKYEAELAQARQDFMALLDKTRP